METFSSKSPSSIIFLSLSLLILTLFCFSSVIASNLNQVHFSNSNNNINNNNEKLNYTHDSSGCVLAEELRIISQDPSYGMVINDTMEWTITSNQYLNKSLFISDGAKVNVTSGASLKVKGVIIILDEAQLNVEANSRIVLHEDPSVLSSIFPHWRLYAFDYAHVNFAPNSIFSSHVEQDADVFLCGSASLKMIQTTVSISSFASFSSSSSSSLQDELAFPLSFSVNGNSLFHGGFSPPKESDSDSYQIEVGIVQSDNSTATITPSPDDDGDNKVSYQIGYRIANQIANTPATPLRMPRNYGNESEPIQYHFHGADDVFNLKTFIDPKTHVSRRILEIESDSRIYIDDETHIDVLVKEPSSFTTLENLIPGVYANQVIMGSNNALIPLGKFYIESIHGYISGVQVNIESCVLASLWSSDKLITLSQSRVTGDGRSSWIFGFRPGKLRASVMHSAGSTTVKGKSRIESDIVVENGTLKLQDGAQLCSREKLDSSFIHSEPRKPFDSMITVESKEQSITMENNGVLFLYSDRSKCMDEMNHRIHFKNNSIGYILQSHITAHNTSSESSKDPGHATIEGWANLYSPENAMIGTLLSKLSYYGGLEANDSTIHFNTSLSHLTSAQKLSTPSSQVLQHTDRQLHCGDWRVKASIHITGPHHDVTYDQSMENEIITETPPYCIEEDSSSSSPSNDGAKNGWILFGSIMGGSIAVGAILGVIAFVGYRVYRKRSAAYRSL